jgi:hypothetical protein
MARSGWVAVLITALLVGGFGSPAANEAAGDSGFDVKPVATAVTAFPQWSTDAFGGDSDMVGPIVLKVVLLLACVFLCAGLAGRVGPSMASFLGGWGALMVSAALAAAVFNVVSQLVIDKESSHVLGHTLVAANGGALFGLYTGWLVGAAVAIAARNARIEPRWVPPVPGPVSSDGQVAEYPRALPPGPPAVPDLSGWPAAPASAAGPATGSVDLGSLSSSEFPSAADYSELSPATEQVAPAPPVAPPQAAPEEVPDDPDAPVWSTAWPGRSSGAYNTESQQTRPSWTRWSSNDDS